MTFHDWVAIHCERFGLDRPAERAMVQSWQPAFAAAGFTLEDLMSATDYMTTRAAPRFRTDHLALIQQHVSERRRVIVREAEEFDRGFDAAECDLCRNCGWVIVPHPRYVVEGKWQAPFPTCAVVCSCSRGRHYHEADQADYEAKRAKGRRQPSLTLETYARKFPDWQAIQADGLAAKALIHGAVGKAAQLDQSLGEIRQRTAAAFAMPGRE